MAPGPGPPAQRFSQRKERRSWQQQPLPSVGIVEVFKEAEASGGATGYQTLINEALRQHVEGKAPKLEETLRRVLREEMRVAS
jgi:hypothetical protein